MGVITCYNFLKIATGLVSRTYDRYIELVCKPVCNWRGAALYRMANKCILMVLDQQTNQTMEISTVNSPSVVMLKTQ